MNVCFPGAHNIESRETGFSCVVIDDVLAIDAGALTASMSFSAQRALKALLLTHRHYDHIKDTPSLAMNFYLSGGSIGVYGTKEVCEDLSNYLFDGRLYPDFRERPPDNPAVRFTIVEPYRTEQVAGYAVLPVPVNHSVPTVGYQVTSPEGATLFVTGDTGPGLGECWQHVSPQLLVIELTLPDEQAEFARMAGHMTPAFLKEEMIAFREARGYLPQIVTVHMNPELEEEIEIELDEVAEALNTPITLAYEGMRLELQGLDEPEIPSS